MTLGETALIRTSRPFKLPDAIPFVRREPISREISFGYCEAREKGACICVSETGYFLPNKIQTEGGPGWGWGSLYYMRMRPLQDKHDDRSPRLVKHSGIWQQKAVLVGGPKVWAIYKWWFARISEPFPSVSFFSLFLPCDKIFSNARLMFILFHHDNVMGGFGHWLY